MNVSCIIPSAGIGRRMRYAACSKPFIKLGNLPILAHTLRAIERCSLIKEIILVVNKKDIAWAKFGFVRKYGFKKISAVVKGGSTRLRSVYNGLCQIDPKADLVLIHDGVRPFVSKNIIKDAILAAQSFGAAIAAVPAESTIKEADNKKNVVSTLKREKIWIVQTPQVFKKDILFKAYRKALAENIKATDDATLVEKLGHPVKIVMGSYDNIKITTPEDLAVAEAILRKRTPHFRVGNKNTTLGRV